MVVRVKKKDQPAPARMSRPKLGRSSTSPLLSSAGDDTIMPAMPKSPTLAHFEQYMNKSSDNDGPLFRAVLSELERKALSLRKTVKEVLKAASKCSQCWSETILCQQQLSIALADLCSTGDPLKSNLASLYTSPALQIAEETYSKSIHSLEANLIAPLRAVANDLKAVPSKRKEFDAETKAFDAHMASVSFPCAAVGRADFAVVSGNETRGGRERPSRSEPCISQGEIRNSASYFPQITVRSRHLQANRSDSDSHIRSSTATLFHGSKRD